MRKGVGYLVAHANVQQALLLRSLHYSGQHAVLCSRYTNASLTRSYFSSCVLRQRQTQAGDPSLVHAGANVAWSSSQSSSRAERLSEAEKHKISVEDIRSLAETAAEEAQEEAVAAARSLNDSPAPSKTTALRNFVRSAVNALGDGLIERETEARLLLLAAMSKEHILFIGPPGTAKSELGRRLSYLFRGSYFERLLTRFSVPEEIFGPLSMRALQDDQYIRQTQGYLPDASVAFIDEIFKANSAILNTLLTILNERTFDNGSQRIAVPLTCLVGASNELPESEELDALYDRFLIRREVKQVSTSGLPALLSLSNAIEEDGQPISPVFDGPSSSTPILDLPEGDFEAIRSKALQCVAVPDTVQQLLIDLRTHLQEKCEPPIYISDRRLLKAMSLMKVAAYTDNRGSVSLRDCLLLQHLLWQRPDESARIADFVLSHLASDEKGIAQADYIFQGMFARACQTTSTQGPVRELLEEVQEMRGMLVGKLAGVYGSQQQQGGSSVSSVWSSEEEDEAVSAAVTPKLARAKEDVKRLLFEVVTLQVSLRHEPMVSTIMLADLFKGRWGSYIRKGPIEEAQAFGTQATKRRGPSPMAKPP